MAANSEDNFTDSGDDEIFHAAAGHAVELAERRKKCKR
jgi:hypothetical protein